MKKNSYTSGFFFFLISFVYALLIFVIFPVFKKKNIIGPFAVISCGIVLLLFFFLSTCRNPGYLKSPKKVKFSELLEQFDPVSLCPDCEIIRTKRSRHCAICGKCVERFDHHCPWVNNCVGAQNHTYFIWFLISIILTLVSTITCLIYSLNKYGLSYIEDGNCEESTYFIDSRPTLCDVFVFLSANVIVLVICFFFLLPVSALTIVQFGNFVMNKTTSERFAKAKVSASTSSSARTSSMLSMSK